MAKKVEYPKLPKRFVDKWTKALRSGKYQQAEGQLVVKEYPEDSWLDNGETKGYCCLGVALACNGLTPTEDAYIEPYMTNDKIPKELIGENLLTIHLSKMNDGGVMPGETKLIQKRSFKQIATWIEKNLVRQPKTKKK